MSTVKIQIDVDLKTIRKAFVMIDQDIPSDEEILSKMGQEPTFVNLDLLGPDAVEAKLGIAMMAIFKAFNLDV